MLAVNDADILSRESGRPDLCACGRWRMVPRRSPWPLYDGGLSYLTRDDGDDQPAHRDDPPTIPARLRSGVAEATPPTPAWHAQRQWVPMPGR